MHTAMSPVQIGAIVVLALSFVKDLIDKREGKKNIWSRTIIITAAVLLLNAYLVIANHRGDVEHQKAQERKEEKRQAELRADIRSLSESATQAFDKLQRTLVSLPADSAKTLGVEAKAIQDQLNALTESVAAGHIDPTSITRAQTSISNIEKSVNRLSSDIDRVQIQQIASQHSDSPSGSRFVSEETFVGPAQRYTIPPPSIASEQSSSSIASAISPVGRLLKAQDSNSLPPNVQGTNDAWQALRDKRPKDASDKADEVIEEFKAQAERMQADLKSKNTPDPIIGKPSTERDKATILDRGPLNDVATCYFIKGQALELLDDRPGAKQAYEAACHLSYARAWDTRGWFWDPADKSCRLARRMK